MEKRIGYKIYKQEDQIEFAKISKDYNDIHLEKNIARKLIFGQQIVHGVNILITALKLLKNYNKKIRVISCEFKEPIFLYKKITFFKIENNSSTTILVKSNKEIKTIISINNDIHNIYKNDSIKLDNSKKNKKILINRNKFLVPKNYLGLKKFFSEVQIKEILSLSFFIGIIYPGKYSLIAGLHIDFRQNLIANSNISFSVIKIDQRINKSIIEFQGNIIGNIFAFSYKIPIFKNIEKLKKKIRPINTLKNKSSLIIGGSRGLGEITSKILSILGSKIYLTYYMGKIEATKIKDDIQKIVKNECKIIKLNMLDKKFITKIKDISNIDYIFYFASPKILNSNFFDIKLFNNYKKIYCDNFYKICKTLNSKSKKKIKVFYPSTIFLDYKIKKFREYVKAKSHGEKIVKKINKQFKNINVCSIRLPEMNTSQNISILKRNKIDNEKIMTSIIKDFVTND